MPYLVIAFFASFFFSYILVKILIPKLLKAGISGIDVNKPKKQQIAEMGGIGIVGGFVLGVLFAVFFNTFFGFEFNLNFVLAGLLTIFVIAFIGFVDDLLDIPQIVKAFLPLAAGIPLIAVRAAGSTVMDIPFFGSVDFGMIYLFIFIPVGIAVASNLTNMLAGFNGIEAGMGIIVLLCASLVAFNVHSAETLVLYVPFAGALIGFLLHNFYPSKVFPGDIGTLVIGATIATGAIIGNFEAIAALLMLPYVIDFFIKAKNCFPSTKWWGEWKQGKLYPVENKIRGAAQLVMKIANGIREIDLVLVFIIIQGITGIIVLLLFLF